MAIAEVQKILIALHKSEENQFLKALQNVGIVHISHPAESYEVQTPATSIKETIDQINATIDFLQTYVESKGILANLKSSQPELERNEYFNFTKQYKFTNIISKVNELKHTLSTLSNQKKNLENNIILLTPWLNLKSNLKVLYQHKYIEITLGSISNPIVLQKIQSDLADLPLEIQIVNTIKDIRYCLIAYPKDKKDIVKEHLQYLEIVDLSQFDGIPHELIKEYNHKIQKIDEQYQNCIQQIRHLTQELTPLKIMHDYYLNLQSLEDLKPNLKQSNQVIFIEGWIKKRDYNKLQQLINSFQTVVVAPLKKQVDEEPPVALENKSIFKPFEIILELYTMPKPTELDPTPLLAPFFAVFFALCLTDAGYGIVSLVLALLLLKKMKAADKFLKLLAICGGFTILAGAITGGWFGDIVDKLGLQFLVKFRDSLILFDPIKDPMPFFILSVALGYLHLNYGIIIEIYDSFRQKNWQGAILDQLPWFLFLNGLILYVFTGKYLPVSLRPYLIFIILLAISTIIAFTRRNQQLMFNQTLFGFVFLGGLIYLTSKINLSILPNQYHSLMLGKYLVLFGLIALSAISLISQIRLKKFKLLSIITLVALVASLIGYAIYRISVIPFLVLSLFFTMLSPDHRKLIKSIIWGVYNLYGATSFIGVVLSYIRLMALGMVTAGIGMAINTIAWMVIKIPIIGIIIAIIFLIFGHAYNLAINILGAFVHSLRLNYVEFFPRFFTGGGEKFTPFEEQTKYVTIK